MPYLPAFSQLPTTKGMRFFCCYFREISSSTWSCPLLLFNQLISESLVLPNWHGKGLITEPLDNEPLTTTEVKTEARPSRISTGFAEIVHRTATFFEWRRQPSYSYRQHTSRKTYWRHIFRCRSSSSGKCCHRKWLARPVHVARLLSRAQRPSHQSSHYQRQVLVHINYKRALSSTTTKCVLKLALAS